MKCKRKENPVSSFGGLGMANQPISEKLPKWHFLTHAWNLIWAKLLHKYIYWRNVLAFFTNQSKVVNLTKVRSYSNRYFIDQIFCHLRNKLFWLCTDFKSESDDPIEKINPKSSSVKLWHSILSHSKSSCIHHLHWCP